MLKTSYEVNGITIIEMPVSMFKIVWLDREKRTGTQVTKDGNFANAGYWGHFDEPTADGTVSFTLPVAHLKCDIYPGFQLHAVEDHYMNERGRIEGSKFIFDGGKWSYMNPTNGKAVSTLFIRNKTAFVRDVVTLDDYGDADYIVSGVPCLRYGDDVSCYNYVLPQGWGKDTLRATSHIFVGVKKDFDDKIYLMHYKSTSDNLIYGMEFYNKVKGLGFYDILKLDGGGSTIMKSPDLSLSKMTSTVRIINNVITFDEPDLEPEIDRELLITKLNDVQIRIENAQLELDTANHDLADIKTMLGC